MSWWRENLLWSQGRDSEGKLKNVQENRPERLNKDKEDILYFCEQQVTTVFSVYE